MTAVLLDTHVVLWWLEGSSKIPPSVGALLRDPASQVFVSAASAWEISIKYKAGKLEAASTLISRFEAVIEEQKFVELAISIRHAIRAGMLEGTHKDPFDRMLIAQARVENLPVVSTDRCFDRYAVKRIW